VSETTYGDFSCADLCTSCAVGSTALPLTYFATAKQHNNTPITACDASAAGPSRFRSVAVQVSFFCQKTACPTAGSSS
jgi:hypothetical protein